MANVKTRVKLKHDTAANWALATNFVPLAGELIIYDVDANNSSPRFKVGDGATKVANLPFSDANLYDHTHDDRYYTIEQIDGFEFISIADIDEICGGVTEGGLHSSDIDELMAQLEEV